MCVCVCVCIYNVFASLYSALFTRMWLTSFRILQEFDSVYSCPKIPLLRQDFGQLPSDFYKYISNYKRQHAHGRAHTRKRTRIYNTATYDAAVYL